MLDLKRIRKNKMQRLKINRKMKKPIENPARNAKKKRIRKSQKGEDEINTRLELLVNILCNSSNYFSFTQSSVKKSLQILFIY